MDIQSKSLALLGGVGNAIGDVVQGIQVLKHIQRIYPEIKINLFKKKGSPSDWFYLKSGLPFNEIPESTNALLDCLNLVDLRQPQLHPDFYTQSTFDFVLGRLGFTPDFMPEMRKRPDWLSDLELPTEALYPVRGQNYIFINVASASFARKMPLDFAALLTRQVKQSFPSHWLVFNGLTNNELFEIDPDINHINATGKLSGSLSWLQTIKQADLVITPDSAAYHMAEGLGVKSLVFFTNVKPLSRLGTYMHAVGLDLDPDTNFSDRMEIENPDRLRGIESVWRSLSPETLKSVLDQLQRSGANPAYP